jgi:hypothetical protein
MVTIESILRKIDKVLKDKGEAKKGETYYPPISIGGDYIGKYISREYRSKDIRINDFKEVFNDKSGHHHYVINYKKKIFPLIYKFECVFDVNLDLETKKTKINYFKNGGWENKIEGIIK